MMEFADIICRLQIHHTKGRVDMAVKKKFPYKAAIVSCNGGCRAVKGEAGCSEGCIGCGACKKGLGKCCIDDVVNEFVLKAAEADGYIFGSPVHYAAIGGAMGAFMDRAFYSGGKSMAFKPAAGVVSCRRGGASAAFDQLNKYFTINNMPVVGSQYWNQVHGNLPEQVLQDAEGLQTLSTLAKNMAWLLKCNEAGKNAGIACPVPEKVIRTNFIR